MKKCVKLMLFFVLFCLQQASMWAQDLALAVEKIEQARLQLTVLGQSLALRETDLSERELNLRTVEETLTLDRLALIKDKQSLVEREQTLTERENALPETQKQLQTLTDSYKMLSQRLDQSKVVGIVCGVLALAGWSAFGVSLLLN